MHDDIQHRISGFKQWWVQVANWGRCAPDDLNVKISHVFGCKLWMNLSPCRWCFEHVWSTCCHRSSTSSSNFTERFGRPMGTVQWAAPSDFQVSKPPLKAARAVHLRQVPLVRCIVNLVVQWEIWGRNRTGNLKKQGWKRNHIIIMFLFVGLWGSIGQVHHGEVSEVITFIWVQCLLPIPAPLQPQGPRVSRRAMAGFDKPIDVPRRLEVWGIANLEDQPTS